MDKAKVQKGATIVTEKMKGRLAKISDHSKDLELRRSAISAIIVEFFVFAVAYTYKFFNISFALALTALSVYHIIRMFLQVKKAKEKTKEKIIPNAIIAGFHLLIIVLAIIALI